MHVVMLSDVENQGGAAVAASRLAQGLCEAGHQVTRVVAVPEAHEHLWSTYALAQLHPLSLSRRAVGRLFPPDGRRRWEERVIENRLDSLLKDMSPDVINAHNLHQAIERGWSAELLRVCAAHAPTVWTLHDMWSFTGRCVYSYDCEKFLIGCDAACPTSTEYPALAPERIGEAWELRSRLLISHSHLVAVAPSRWLAREAKKGLWANHRVEVIPYGLPLEVYRPLDRALAREALGIDMPGPVLLVAAQILTDRRKGGDILKESLLRLSRRPLALVTLGTGRLHVEAEGIFVRELGHVDDERTKVLAYSAADLFVHPAPVDNLPNVVMEALACGTPVVGFAIGGMPDMVRPGQTGWLSDEVSPDALAGALEAALDELDHGVDLRCHCRALAEAEYPLALQAQRYGALFQSVNGKT